MSKELFNLCLDYVNGVVSKHEKDNYTLSNDAIRLALFEIMELEPTTKWGTKEARAFRLHKNEIYTLIEEVIDASMPTFMQSNEFYEAFVEYKNVDFGDEQGFYIEDNSYFTVSDFSGYHWDTRREKVQAGASVKIPTSWKDLHFYTELIDVLTGKIDFSKLINKARRSIVKYIADQVTANFFNIDTYLPAELRPAGTFNTAELNRLITGVSTANNGSPVIIAATKAMLDMLTGNIADQWVSGDMANEKNNAGVLRMWDGNRLMTIPTRIQPGTYTNPEPNQNKFFILPSSDDLRPIKVVSEGGALTRAITAAQGNKDMTYDEQIQFKLGSGVVFGGEVFATYTVTP